MRGLKSSLFLSALSFSVWITPTFALADEATPDTSCIETAQWLQPDGRKVLNGQTLIKSVADSPIALLGESHSDANHHRWQLQTIIQLYTLNSKIALGFEMFPRRVQPALDAWVRGELTEQEFLDQTDWDEVWRFDPDIYMPLFRFAKMNKIPMYALNVERDMISMVGEKGWENVPEDKREGITTPYPAKKAYKESLRDVFFSHAHVGDGDDTPSNTPEMRERFDRFVQAQQTWDGAMAQGLRDLHKKDGFPLAIGVMGSGHLIDRHGVPYQLEQDGIRPSVLVPWTIGNDCANLSTSFADAIFGVDAPEPDTSYKPLLGVRIQTDEKGRGVAIEQVVEESVAEDAGLQSGDIVTVAALVPVKTAEEFISVIRRQAPGTWLPLSVERDGKSIDIVAKFPLPEETE